MRNPRSAFSDEEEGYGCICLVWIRDVWSHLDTGAAIPGDAEQGDFVHMLDRPDHVRIKMPLYCPNCERIVERSEIVKGYKYGKGEYVIIEPGELKKIELRTATAMEILELVKADEIDPVYFQSSYYLLPEEAGRRSYALLSQAIEETNFLAIAKPTLHNHEYTVILRPHNGGLMLHTVFYKVSPKPFTRGIQDGRCSRACDP